MRTKILILLTASLMVGSTHARSELRTLQDKKEEAKDPKGPTTAAAVQSTGQEPAYKIGPQDVLKIDVWREDQLTRTVPVRPDGMISLPLLNDVQAAGLTAMQLASTISEGLKKYINNPQVTVSVTEINSRRIYVTGEVAKAWAYPSCHKRPFSRRFRAVACLCASPLLAQQEPKPAAHQYSLLLDTADNQQDTKQVTQSIQPDNQPLSGVQNPTLGTPEIRHSYWVPGIEYSNTSRSNSLNGGANSGWNTTSFVSTDLSLLGAWRHSTLSANYSGGGYFSTDS